MKPIQLELRWFGQYTKSQVVQFDQLQKLFLITGETGAGKTTLFDAMSYALYGRGLGARTSAIQLRSQLAGPKDSTVVKFTFEVSGTRWEVERSPYTFVREKRTGTVETDTYVLLTRLTGPDAPERVPPDEVNDRLRRVLALRFEDFSKILVLPQGEFQQFLSMKSSERATLLKTLFPVSQHEQIARLAKEDAKELKAKVEENEARTAEAMRDFDPNTFTEQDASLTLRVATLRAAEEAREGDQKTAEAALHDARTLAGQIATLAQRDKDRAAHELGRTEHTAREARLDAARRAAAALPAAEREATLRDEIARIEGQIVLAAEAETRATQAREALRDDHDALPAREQALADATRAADALRIRLTDLQALETARADEERLGHAAEEHTVRFKAATKRVTEANELITALDKVSDARDAALPELKAARESVERCRRAEPYASACTAWTRVREPELAARIADARVRLNTLRQAEDAAETELAEAQARVESDAALLLAATLRPGEECPVCGSEAHPHPRSGRSGATDAVALRSTAEAGVKRAREARTLQAGQVGKEEATYDAEKKAADTARVALEQAGHATPESWKAASDAASAELAPLEAADIQFAETLAERHTRTKTLVDAREAVDRAASEARTAAEAYAGAQGTVAACVGRVGDVTDVAAERGATKQRVDEADRGNRTEADAIRATRESWERAEIAVTGAASTRNALDEQMGHKRSELPSIAQAASDALKDSVFSTLADAREVAMIPRDVEALQKRVNEWIRVITDLTAQIEELQRGIGERPAPDVPAIEEAARKATAEARAAAEERGAAEKLQSNLRSKNDRVVQLRAERAALLADSRGLLIVSKHLNGEVAPKIDFATWMLTWWLERVLAHANGQLRALSDGRYLFRLRTQQRDGRALAGLDVDVLDTWSNQLRDVNALSGGEKFLASLSLALGLADVVQGLNGGVQLDTLFIDEGFGSLDAETLNRAMELIDHLSQHRAVGLISHVEAMQKAIFSQVRVTKSPAGSTVTVVNVGTD